MILSAETTMTNSPLGNGTFIHLNFKQSWKTAVLVPAKAWIKCGMHAI